MLLISWLVTASALVRHVCLFICETQFNRNPPLYEQSRWRVLKLDGASLVSCLLSFRVSCYSTS
jgi:hypothetical protein